jgi:formylmethanofuran dehydrogenase subunit E
MIRGHLKVLCLKALGEGEKSGYGLMKYIEEHMGHKPSSGSIYPLLEQLKNDGLLALRVEGRKKVYSLTNKGKKVELEIEGKRDEMLAKFQEGFKVISALTGEDMSACEHIMEHVKKGEMPFKEYNPELHRFRMLLFKLHANASKNKKQVKKILADATQKLRKL